MRVSEIGGETRRLLRARPISTAFVAFLAASMVVAVLMTVGRTVVLEQAVYARTETPEGRTIAIIDTGSSGLIRPEIVRILARMDGVERVVATTTPVDGVNLHLDEGGTRFPVWGVSGNIEDLALLRTGRLPEPGEVLVSETALALMGIGGPFGAVRLPDGQELPIVGTYDARSPFGEMSAGAVHRLPERSDGLRILHIVAVAVRQIDPVTVAAVGLFESAPTDELRVERAAALAELQQMLAGDVSSFGRELIVAVLLAGMLLVALTVLVEVLARRKDLGRQRALGARRSTVIVLLAVRTAAAAAIGSIVGLAAGLVYLSLTTRQLPEPSFSAGLVVLSILTPSLASILPAWWAAQRDPVLELRTP